MTTPERVALILFDGLDVSDLEAGIAEGWLPTMRELLSSGQGVRLSAPHDVLGDATLPSLVTGTHLDAHQVLFNYHFDQVGHRVHQASSLASGEPPFWRYLGDAGLRTLMVGVYSAPLVRDLPGVQLAWGPLDPWWTPLHGQAAHPREALAELEREVGPRDVSFWYEMPRTVDDALRYSARLRDGARQQGRGLAFLARRYDWHLLATTFGEGHIAGHLLWDRARGLGDAPAQQPVTEALRSVYATTDEQIGRLVGALPDRTMVLVGSGYGMTAKADVNPVLPDVLERAGFLRRRDLVRSPDRRLRVLARGRSAVRRLVPPALRPALGRLVPRDRWLTELELADVMWQDTSAFPLPTDISGHVRVNLRGRERLGTVRPGAYDAACDELVELMGSLRDASTGEPVVTRAVRTDRLLGGPVTGPLPDVNVGWRHGTPVARIAAPSLGEFPVPPSEIRTGVHRGPGFVIATGPGIAASAQRRLSSDAAVVDLAPTVLAAFGVDAPAHLAGTPIRSLARV